MKAPFPWFGGKSKVASFVWDRFGNVPNYVEPFAGSLAVLLKRPHAPRNETVNDKDAMISNFWRAIHSRPDEVAFHADWPVNEADLHARHQWLVNNKDFRERILTDPDHFDCKVAGWWVWGISQWIGSGWCSEPGWRGTNAGRHARGIHRQRPQIDRGSQLDRVAAVTVTDKRPRLGRGERGVHAKRPMIHKGGCGVQRTWQQMPDVSADGGRGIFAERPSSNLEHYFDALAGRLRRVRVCCGDWTRVLGPSPTTKIGLTGVFLDPPYSVEDRAELYNEESRKISLDVREWAIDHGSDPQMRIALCGYEGEHDMPDDWECVAWKANGGYANQQTEGTQGKLNAHRERVWFSPHCIHPGLFAEQYQIGMELA